MATIDMTCAMESEDVRRKKEIFGEAWWYAYALLQHYKTFFCQMVNEAYPGYIGKFCTFKNYSRLYTPADNDIVSPNNDTPYSWAWADLRAEPVVLSLPAVPRPRYYVNHWFDMYTHAFAYTGVRTTGREAGNYMFVGPTWTGTVPPGIKKVFRAETWFIGTLTRTQMFDNGDREELMEIQNQYKLVPLSEFICDPCPPPPSPPVDWPVWNEELALGPEFIRYLNFLLKFMPIMKSEATLFERFSEIGIAAGAPFDAAALPECLRAAYSEVAKDALLVLRKRAAGTFVMDNLFGSREELGPDYIQARSLGAFMGIYGNTKSEAVYRAWARSPTGEPLSGNKKWVLRFEPGQLFPVDIFWSVTMYSLPSKQLVSNRIDRYSIRSSTPELMLGDDGSLEIYIQHDSPGEDKESNWLPAPSGNFALAGRMYGPKQELLDGSWKVPALRLVQ